MIVRSVVLAAALSLAACASTAPPPYVAATSATSAGFSETRIESSRYRVSFRAPSGADASVLERYALQRAADLTLQNGRDWFWVDRRNTDETDARASGPSVGVGVGGGSWGRRSGASVGVGVNFPLGGRSGPRATVSALEIRFGDGLKPDAPNAYDARSILETR